MRYDPIRGSFRFSEEDEAWRQKAACKGEPVDIWFPPVGGPSEELKIAVSICSDCPVTKECKDYANKHDIEHGIWGGLGARRRRYSGQ